MNPAINLNCKRAKEARLSYVIGRTGFNILAISSGTLFVLGFILFIASKPGFGYFCLSLSLVLFLPAVWWKIYLSILPVSNNSVDGRLSLEILGSIKHQDQIDTSLILNIIKSKPQSIFLLNHLLITQAELEGAFDNLDINQILDVASRIADDHHSKTIHSGFVMGALLLNSDKIKQELTSRRGKPEDILAVIDWLGRNLEDNFNRQTRYGGIARDWAYGFTPLLDRLGHNVSFSIMKYRSQFDWLTQSKTVLAMEDILSRQVSNVTLVGPEGIGKTTSVYALAQKLIEGQSNKNINYHQIVELNASDITARATRPGEIENIMINAINEASLAGHIILFLDNAESFLISRPGAFDGSQILSSILDSNSCSLILSFNEQQYQMIKVKSPGLANKLNIVNMPEFSQTEVMHILEDNCINLENRNNCLISYESLKESYNLSGRYDDGQAYPGKAIKLLNSAISFNVQGIVTAYSVQQAVEQTYGVKVTEASAAESSQLLNLEDEIHNSMINQTHAVSVVANAIRRNRAGVNNPNRPIGSFMFLGPTGVGKTELAKALARTYFGSQSSMIRLDMSEYQNPDDVKRLLSTGEGENSSLILSIRKQPFSLVLLDEIEKAHPNILNLLLQILDEGELSDESGKAVSFKDSIIITTSNAGADFIRQKISEGQSIENLNEQLTDQLINSGTFKPELINRYDDIVIFRPLTNEELKEVVGLMIAEINQTIEKQNLRVELTDAAIEKVVSEGNDPRLGARPLRRMLQRTVENTLAKNILSKQLLPGDKLVLDESDIIT